MLNTQQRRPCFQNKSKEKKRENSVTGQKIQNVQTMTMKGSQESIKCGIANPNMKAESLRLKNIRYVKLQNYLLKPNSI